MDVSKWSLVIINEKKRENLSKLIGNPVGGGVAVASENKKNVGESWTWNLQEWW